MYVKVALLKIVIRIILLLVLFHVDITDCNTACIISFVV